MQNTHAGAGAGRLLLEMKLMVHQEGRHEGGAERHAKETVQAAHHTAAVQLAWRVCGHNCRPPGKQEKAACACPLPCTPSTPHPRSCHYPRVMFWLSQQPGFKDSRYVSVHTSLGTTFGTSVPSSLQQAGSTTDNTPNVSVTICP